MQWKGKAEANLHAQASILLVGEGKASCTVLAQLVAALHTQQRLQTCKGHNAVIHPLNRWRAPAHSSTKPDTMMRLTMDPIFER